jgi:hypothetical protein
MRNLINKKVLNWLQIITLDLKTFQITQKTVLIIKYTFQWINNQAQNKR